MIDSGIQLEMKFDERDNRFKESLDMGTFYVLFEIDTPGKNEDFASAVYKASEMEYAVSEIKNLPTGLAISDKLLSPDSWNIASFASEVCKSAMDKHVLYISGKNTPLETMLETIKSCEVSGFRNIVPVTGDGIPGETIKQTRKRTFTESIHILNYISSNANHFFPGCPVNPFKYTPNDLFTQYYKLIKKINLGADFLVTQIGWDMLKHQELRWYLTHRGHHIPSIARLQLLTPEKVEQIAAGQCPGIHISPDFQDLLSTENRYSCKQFEAAQWRRLQMQIVGCKLLGYSGVQIAGLNNPEQVRIAGRRITEALDEFHAFDEWKDAYLEHLGRAEMAPYPYRFYLFDELFSHAHLDESPRMNKVTFLKSSNWENACYKISHYLFSSATEEHPDKHRLLKKLLTGCSSCNLCRLPLTHYICPETCPKRLANGPCGGTQAHGNCEFGNRECIHARRMRLAIRLNQIDTLEESYIASP